jgi:hypothetical protein
MSNEINPVNPAGNDGYERSDLGVRPVLYFLGGLALAIILAVFAVEGLYFFLDKRSESRQTAISPLVTDAPKDTRQIAPDYPQTVFPDPRLEVDERGQLKDIRLNEERSLASYGWVDEKGGVVRIPIDRAMDLIVQRGLPTRSQGQTAGTETAAVHAPVANTETKKAQPAKTKGRKK